MVFFGVYTNSRPWGPDEFLANAKLMQDIFFGDARKETSGGFVDGLTTSDSDDSCGNDPPGDPDVLEGFDGKVAALGKRRMVLCSTNDTFDHYVVTGDSLPDVKTEGLPQPRRSQAPLTDDDRPLEMVDDEEFDIPPIFDDTKYVTGDTRPGH
ncbi:unnamed protein product [Microthlaspi erraticum]|uniref:Uncharacterized protein n=1 Tax=Microthlaspi erraticum TaxID=1685480 RepID=A0A6D2IDD4_9BRAS|nr:unnamed protein product [Microthlaspi erraticum]